MKVGQPEITSSRNGHRGVVWPWAGGLVLASIPEVVGMATMPWCGVAMALSAWPIYLWRQDDQNVIELSVDVQYTYSVWHHLIHHKYIDSQL